MVVAKATKEALRLKDLVKELCIQQGGVQLHYDSQGSIYLAKNQVYHARTKQIDVRFHRTRKLVFSGEMLQEKVHTFENTIDMLIKSITTNKFKHC
jgi:ribonuclease HIII